MGRGKEGPIVAADGGADVSLIAPLERDMALELHAADWGRRLRSPWHMRADPHRHFSRDITVEGGRRSGALREFIVRFPSAPIYGINRRQDYDEDFSAVRPSLHTARLLMRPTGRQRRPVDRLFILHNGLNESQNLRFFYRLADWILKEDDLDGTPRRSACLVAPFPGHLMHFPYAGSFSQTPLSRYLTDAGDLFRQFLRYMVEMNWLLSAIGEERPADWQVGNGPLPGDHEDLPGQMLSQWEALHAASLQALGGTKGGDHAGTAIGKPEIASAIETLDALLGREHREAPMPVHVVGYSLGGFLAQSVFFASPNMVTSCATICSGGAISALTPTAFAHSEEWQAVLHALRTEIEGSMLAGKMTRDPQTGRVAGMPNDQFGYFQRIFNQVFLQEDQASYKQRLSEYGARMLFVSGGEDPIVKTRDVLDAAPAEGITMLSVARLTHFLGEDARTTGEDEQREFWLPEAGGLIARAASRAEELKALELDRATALRFGEASPGFGRRRAGRPEGPDLASPEFEDALDWVVDQVSAEEGWLFIFRNTIPAAFLPPDQHQATGAGLHHHDVAVQAYAAGLKGRAAVLGEVRSRTTLTVSEKLKPQFIGSQELFEPNSDAPGKLSTEKARHCAWEYFCDNWEDCVRRFRAGPIRLGRNADPVIERSFARAVARWEAVPLPHLRVTRLPDVWISLRVPEVGLHAHEPERAAMDLVAWVGAIIKENQSTAAKAAKDRRHSEELAAHLAAGRVRIVRVSGTELNPRYRGRFVERPEPSLAILAHCAAALVRSIPASASGAWLERAVASGRIDEPVSGPPPRSDRSGPFA